eukprot:163453-Pelagomonas_calceolata.AAC.1
MSISFACAIPHEALMWYAHHLLFLLLSISLYSDAALLPYKTGLRWLKAGISQLELLAENDLRSLGQATLTGATPSAFRINLSGVSSSLLENIRIFDGLFGDQG